jgi:DNA (cytosine-5)-methyltransferase 1
MANHKDKIKAISLFCGCGGADLGLVGGFEFLGVRYPRTGIRIIHASDINAKAVETYNLNFRHKAVVDDIANLSFKKGEADIVIGGFPCQAFSTVNPTKKPHHKKNQLFLEMANVVRKVRPKIFIAENVKGFYCLSNGKYFRLAKEKFQKLGYKIYDKLVDMSEHGVPQLRERLFMVGIKNDIRHKLKKDFEFPEPDHGEQSSIKKPKVPLKSVIDSLIPPDPKYYFSEKALLGVKRAKPNMKRALAQDLEKPCLTITSHLAKVSINSRDPVEKEKDTEDLLLKRQQGFSLFRTNSGLLGAKGMHTGKSAMPCPLYLCGNLQRSS